MTNEFSDGASALLKVLADTNAGLYKLIGTGKDGKSIKFIVLAADGDYAAAIVAAVERIEAQFDAEDEAGGQ